MDSPLEKQIETPEEEILAPRKHEDQIAREKIPQRSDLPTMFHPEQSLLMILPVESVSKVGTILLPDTARIQLNEGHIIEKGPLAADRYHVGDCVTWDQGAEYRMEIDGVKFVLVRDSAIILRIPREELGWVEEPADESRALSS